MGSHQKRSLVAVVEEHGKIGGLYGAVAEWSARRDTRCFRLLDFGSEDRFLHEIGTQEFAREHYGLSVSAMARSVSDALGA